MKKLVAALMSVMLVVAACAFTACAPQKGMGVVDGNYEETDAVKLSAAVKGLNIGSEEAPFSGLGLEFASDSSFSFDMSESYSVKSSAKLGYKFVAGVTEEEITFAGTGSGSVSYKQKSVGASVDYSYSAKVYNDSQFLYLDANGGGLNQKYKIDVASLIEGGIEGRYPEYFANVDGEFNPDDNTGTVVPDGQLSLSQIIAELDALGVKFYMDNADGLKIKVSFDAEAIQKILSAVIEAIASQLPEDTAQMIEDVLGLVKFNTVKLDLYFAFDKEGNFVQFGEDTEISATIQMPSMFESAPAQALAFDLKSGSYLKTYNGTVTLPEGLAADVSYVEINPIG